MEFRGEFQAPTDRQTTWDFVMDPQQIGWCGPGVREIEVLDPTHYRVSARVGIGSIAATFRVNAEVTDVVKGERASVRVTAQAPGTAVEGLATMALEEAESGTRMDWSATVQISGKLAAVGERLIRGTADRLIRQAFDCVRAKLEERAAGT